MVPPASQITGVPRVGVMLPGCRAGQRCWGWQVRTPTGRPSCRPLQPMQIGESAARRALRTSGVQVRRHSVG